jgi:hypothetical protein
LSSVDHINCSISLIRCSHLPNSRRFVLLLRSQFRLVDTTLCFTLRLCCWTSRDATSRQPPHPPTPTLTCITLTTPCKRFALGKRFDKNKPVMRWLQRCCSRGNVKGASAHAHPTKPSQVGVALWPATVTFSGATGITAEQGNGSFIRRDTELNGCPLYSSVDAAGKAPTDPAEVRWLRHLRGRIPIWCISTDESKAANASSCLWYALAATGCVG